MNNTDIYPFVAIVGQERMKLALVLNVVNPGLSGVLIRGEKGTAKSTAVRALAEILPEIEVAPSCPFNLQSAGDGECCRLCSNSACKEPAAGGERAAAKRKVPVVELPVGATEDRVVGSLDIEHALKSGEKRFEPGLLAAAHRGILYADEVNLLDDHIVDILLDSAAMGRNTVEREGVSFTHPARFTLVGTMNPEEGELRPQLLDRFGLCVQVKGIDDPDSRLKVMERRAAFDEDPESFWLEYEAESAELSEKIRRATERYAQVKVDEDCMMDIVKLCISVGVDGHRADIVTLKTAKTLCAFEGRDRVSREDVDSAAEMALPHRVRRQPFEDVADSSLAFRQSVPA